MQGTGLGVPTHCPRAKVQASLVKELLTQAAVYASACPMVVLIEMDPQGCVPIITVGMLYKGTLTRKNATVRLQAVLLSVMKELEESLQQDGVFLDACQKHHSKAERGKVTGDETDPVLTQMLEFCQRCLGCAGDIGVASTALMGTYSKVQMHKTKFGFDSVVTLATPQDVASKEAALQLDSNAFQNTRVCWR